MIVIEPWQWISAGLIVLFLVFVSQQKKKRKKSK